MKYKIGTLLAFLHLRYSYYILKPIVMHPSAQWELIWFAFVIVDFPFSIIQIIFWRISFKIELSIDTFIYPISDVGDFLIPFFIFVVMGTLWYFYIPFLLSKIYHKFDAKNKNNITVSGKKG